MYLQKKIVPLDKRGFPTVVSNVKYYDVKTDGYEIVNLIYYGMFCKYINTQTEQRVV